MEFSLLWRFHAVCGFVQVAAIIIYSAARSSPQALDLCLLSPMTSAYSAMRSVPDRPLIPLEKEMATHSSILAWKSPWAEEPDVLQFMGSQKVQQEF